MWFQTPEPGVEALEERKVNWYNRVVLGGTVKTRNEKEMNPAVWNQPFFG